MGAVYTPRDRRDGIALRALAAAPIFRDFMKEALADVPPTPFRVPQGIVQVPVSPYTGAVMSAGAPGADCPPIS